MVDVYGLEKVYNYIDIVTEDQPIQEAVKMSKSNFDRHSDIAYIFAHDKTISKEELGKFLNENYDLVSQFKGDHHGNPMEKNKYLNSLGLDEDGIKTIETWINLMRSDEYWHNKKYPNGSSYVDLISDISKKINDLPSFVMKYKSVNPIKVVNFLKSYKGASHKK